jgi:hypothetical protein
MIWCWDSNDQILHTWLSDATQLIIWCCTPNNLILLDWWSDASVYVPTISDAIHPTIWFNKPDDLLSSLSPTSRLVLDLLGLNHFVEWGGSCKIGHACHPPPPYISTMKAKWWGTKNNELSAVYVYCVVVNIWLQIFLLWNFMKNSIEVYKKAFNSL